MKTILKTVLVLAISALIVSAAMAQKNDSSAVKNKTKLQNKDDVQQVNVQSREQTRTKAQYKDEDANGVCDSCKVRNKQQKKEQARTRAKKQKGECSGNMVPRGGGSGGRQGRGSGSSNGMN